MAIGRDIVFDYLKDLGVEYMFGVPGTNEIPLIDGTAVEGYGVKFIPCLHENIAVGAAMGYARVSGKPGVVELHLTPGAAHGIGNLFNAYKCHIPLVILCAQQHTDLLAQEALLYSDLVPVARQYTKWSYEVHTADELPLVLQRAFKEALAPPTRPVFISIPWELTLADVDEGPDELPRRVTRVGRRFLGDRDEIAKAAERLATAKQPVIVAGDGVGAAGAWSDLERLAELLGAPVYSESLSSYMNFPNHSPRWQGELPQFQQGMHKVFKDPDHDVDHDVAFLCGFNAQAQILIFKYSLGPLIPPNVVQVYLHDDEWEIGKNGYGEAAILGDIATTLPVLCDAVAQHPGRDSSAAAARDAEVLRRGEERQAALQAGAEAAAQRDGTEKPSGDDVAWALAALQDEMPAPLMLSNEAVSDVPSFIKHPTYGEPKDYFFGQGGSLGFSMPVSLGMKLAAGDERTVVNAVGDGSTLFYPHTWWTAKKYELPILFLITNNREYRTLQKGLVLLETVYSDWKPSGDPWYLRLDDPVMDFVSLAAAFGIAGERVSQMSELDGGLRRGLETVKGGHPFVLEVLTDPSLTSLQEGGRDTTFDHLGPP